MPLSASLIAEPAAGIFLGRYFFGSAKPLSSARQTRLTTAFLRKVITATPCVDLVVLSGIFSVFTHKTFSAELISIISVSSVRQNIPTVGDLSLYAPLRHRRFDLVAYDASGTFAHFPFSKQNNSAAL